MSSQMKPVNLPPGERALNSDFNPRLAQEQDGLPRPVRHLREIARQFPDGWKWIDKIRGSKSLLRVTWPSWCWCPISLIIETVMGSNVLPEKIRLGNPQISQQLGLLGSLALWRTGQGIYRFDPDTYKAVLETDMDIIFPWELFYRLPEWCVYIETPRYKIGETELYGFFCHLNVDNITNRPSICLQLDLATGLQLALVKFPDVKVIVDDASCGDSTSIPVNVNSPLSYFGNMAPIISLVLYLCADNADLGGRRPVKALDVRTKKGYRTLPPGHPRTWDVGVRVGAALRSMRKSEPGEPQGGAHSAHRPHLRKAHWHGYWLGPRKKQEERRFEFRWIQPTLVGVQEEDMPAVTHAVNLE